MATVRIPTSLRKYAHGKPEVTVAGATVREVLAALESVCPGIKERICDDEGGLRRFVNVFVGDNDVRFMKRLDTPVGDADEVTIIPAIAGG
jgi:molybdopterin converting factor small subunit